MNNPVQRASRVQRVRHELKLRELEVSHVTALTPDYVSVTLTGPALADFVSDSFDDHIKLMFADSDGEQVRRDYTPRAFDRDRRELAIEFALHDHGKASDWARCAKPGDRCLVGGPRGSRIIPMDYDWHLLVGDTTALPAIRRRVEELPADARVTVIVLTEKASDQVPLTSNAALSIQWVASTAELLKAVRALQWPGGDGFAWCAGEAATMGQLRDVLVNEKQHPKEAMRVAAYWKSGSADFHETLEG